MIGRVRGRELTSELETALRRAVELERLADNAFRHQRAVAATGALLLAATREGWPATRLAPAVGISAAAVGKRIAQARLRYAGHAPALIVDEPAPDGEHPITATRRTPAEQREWLTRSEAARIYGIPHRTITSWCAYGLLPNTDRTRPDNYLYLRADLDRVQRAPRRGTGQVDRRALLAAIRAAPA